MLKLISFDLDNTLWPMDGVLQKAEQILIEQLSEITQLKNIELQTLRTAKQAFTQENPNIAHDPTLIRSAFLTQYLQQTKGISEKQARQISDDLMRTFLKHRNAVTPFAGTEALLRQLKTQFKLASLTNGNACLNTIGLAHYFNYKISPEIVGTKKPDVKIFEYLLQVSKLKPHEILHVGDHWEDDILGGQTAGLHTLWINPNQKAWPGPPDNAPKGVVSSIHDAPQHIKKLIRT